MKSIKQNRIIVWFMYLVPFFCMGYFAVLVWTLIQITLYHKERKQHERIEERRKKMKKKEKAIKPNRCIGRVVEVSKGVHIYERK